MSSCKVVICSIRHVVSCYETSIFLDLMVSLTKLMTQEKFLCLQQKVIEQAKVRMRKWRACMDKKRWKINLKSSRSIRPIIV